MPTHISKIILSLVNRTVVHAWNIMECLCETLSMSLSPTSKTRRINIPSQQTTSVGGEATPRVLVTQQDEKFVPLNIVFLRELLCSNSLLTWSLSVPLRNSRSQHRP